MQTVNRAVRIAGEAVRQAMNSRTEYTKDDINFVVESLTASSEENITIEIVAKFCIRTYIYSNTGRYSFSFNAILKKTIEIKSSEGIRMLAVMTDTEAFPELHQNSMLTDVERNKILSMVNREYLSSVNTINIAISKSEDKLTLFGEARAEYHSKISKTTKEKWSIKQQRDSGSLYDTTYKYVMMQELAGIDLGYSNMPIITTPSDTIYVMGEAEHSLEIETRQVDYLYFIMQLAKESPVIRDIRLRGEIMEFMKKKYSPEIKMCKYWFLNPV